MTLESKFYSDQFKNFDQSYQLAEKKFKNKHFTEEETQSCQHGRLKGQAILPIRRTKVESIIH